MKTDYKTEEKELNQVAEFIWSVFLMAVIFAFLVIFFAITGV